jgi:iron complex outermembrane receptor protein
MFYGTDFDVVPKNGYIPNYRNFSRDKLDSALMNGSPWTWPYEYKTSTYSAYISDVLNITDNVLVSAAIRVDHFDNKGSFNEAEGKFSGGYQQTTFSPKFGIVWQPIMDKISIFANYQNGFMNQTGVDFNNKPFKPEQANQIEGGVKVNAFGGKLSGTVSYYDIKVKDIVRPYLPDPIKSIQDGTQTSKGVEVGVVANPFRGLNLVAGFAYNDSKMEKADSDVEGLRPATAMSPYAVNLWVSYRLTNGKLKGLGAGFGGNYASDNLILNSSYYGQFTLPAYTVLGATIFYDQPKFRAGIKVDNLTNQEYWIGYTTMNPQKLRSVIGSIAFKF